MVRNMRLVEQGVGRSSISRNVMPAGCLEDSERTPNAVVHHNAGQVFMDGPSEAVFAPAGGYSPEKWGDHAAEGHSS